MQEWWSLNNSRKGGSDWIVDSSFVGKLKLKLIIMVIETLDHHLCLHRSCMARSRAPSTNRVFSVDFKLWMEKINFWRKSMSHPNFNSLPKFWVDLYKVDHKYIRCILPEIFFLDQHDDKCTWRGSFARSAEWWIHFKTLDLQLCFARCWNVHTCFVLDNAI